MSESERLDGWKAIAAYLERPVRTAQRWKKEKGLPVHHRGPLRVVCAYKSDLDSWLQAKSMEKQEFARSHDDEVDQTPRPAASQALDAPTGFPQEGQAGAPDGGLSHRAAITKTRRDIAKMLLVGVACSVLLAAILDYRLTGTRLTAPRVLAYHQLTDDAREKGGQLVTDGRRLYFSEATREGLVLTCVSIQGGAVTRIPVPVHEIVIMDLSPDRSRLLVGTQATGSVRALWTLPVSGGPPRRLGTLAAHSASWSPDGQRIAYANDQSLYLANADGSEPRKVVTAAGFVVNPRWHPDGSQVYFEQADSNGSSSLWEVDTSGDNRRAVLPAWSAPNRESIGLWTGDSKYFLFVSSPNGRADIWTADQKTGLFRRGHAKPVRLTTGPLSFTHLALSPDDRTLFAVGSQEREGAKLVRYDSGVVDFVPYLGGIPALWVNFSRDGRSVAYVKFRENTLWRTKLDGSEAKQLTFAPISVDGPNWSPDGSLIAFRAKKPGRPYKIFLISAEGGKPQELLPQHPDEEGVPTWSPDGHRIVFGDVPVLFGHATGKEAIHIYDLTTRQLSNLPDSKGLWTSRWPPNGRYIAATTIAKQELMLFDFKSSKWRNLGVDQVNDGMTWSHRGDYVYFDLLRPNTGPGIFRVRTSDGRLEQVATLNNLRRAVSWWSGLTPQDAPIVVQEAGTSEIYAIDVEWP